MSDTTSADAGTDSATPVISVRPVTLAAANRGQDLQVRVSAPTTGRDLPVVVFSHGMTLSMDNYAPLAGFCARVAGADGTPGESMADPRVRAAVLLCLPGIGGAGLTPFAAEYFSFMSPDFAGMKTPSLIVAGDHYDSPLTVRDPDWFTDGYRLSPGATDLLTLFGAEHGLGGIQGYNDTRTTDESPARVAVIQRATLAYLRTALGLDDGAWPAARGTLTATSDKLGRIDSK